MNEPPKRPASAAIERSWLIATELARRNAELACELKQVYSSRSWRITAPLRRLVGLLQRQPGTADAWQPTPLPLADPGQEPAALDPARGPSAGRVRWLVDVTDVAINNFRAGVQRVSMRLLGEWLVSPPEGVEIAPVRLTPDGHYCHANRFLRDFTGGLLGGQDDLRVAVREGDLFVGLELVRDYPDPYGRALAEFKAAGVGVAVVVHDLLPLSNPEWFPARTVDAYAGWFDIVANSSDAMLCISEETRKQAAQRIAQDGLPAPLLLVFPMGCDVWRFEPAGDARANTPAAVPFSVLTVGTLEPRKGHDDVLAALEVLWSEGVDIQWRIVGRVGWGVDSLVARLRSHPEAGRRLVWNEWADDAALFDEYCRAGVFVAASRGEGFGLPLAEAGSMGVPLLLRDIPVFREVAGDGATYFTSVAGLADRLRHAHSGQPASSKTQGAWPRWEESAKALAGMLSSIARE